MSYGILLVSHVKEIPEGLKKLIKQVAPDVPITTAGGLISGEVGTDVNLILKAVADNPADNLLAFYDLGSAMMNLELAQDMTEKDVKINDVAFVEGAYTAAALLQADADINDIEAQLKDLKK